MPKLKLALTVTAMLSLATFAIAQPPGEPGARPPHPPTTKELALDGNVALSSGEIEEASTELKGCDATNDGKRDYKSRAKQDGDRRPDPNGPPRGERHGPEQFVNHAMSFDADGDGSLSREELMRFAHEIGRHRHPGGRPPQGAPRQESRQNRFDPGPPPPGGRRGRQNRFNQGPPPPPPRDGGNRPREQYSPHPDRN